MITFDSVYFGVHACLHQLFAMCPGSCDRARALEALELSAPAWNSPLLLPFGLCSGTAMFGGFL